MPQGNRIEINRKGRRIGFLEVPEIPAEDASLPDLEGSERGLGIVAEINGAPVAALIFPWKGESIEIAEPVQWAQEHSTESSQPLARGGLHDSSSLFQLIGEIRRFVRADERRFDFSFSLEAIGGIRGFPIRLEIDDEHGSLRCHFAGEPFFGEARVHGEFRSRAEESELRAYAWIDFIGEGGIAEGYFRGRASARGTTEQGRRGFSIDLFASGRSSLDGRARFVGRGLGGPPFRQFIEETFKRVATTDRPLPFRIWIGAVKYSPELGEAQNQLRRLNALAEGGAELSAAETRETLNWLASNILELRGSTFARIMGPALERLQVSEQVSRVPSQTLNALMEGRGGLSPSDTKDALRWFASTLLQLRDPTFSRAIASSMLERQPARERVFQPLRTEFAARDLSLHFDESVPSEKRLMFLTALAGQISQAGGRLCFAQSKEGSP